MIGLSVKAAQNQFFDRAHVKARVDTGTRRVLPKFGAYVRTRSKSSIKKRKTISQPGKPPSSHVGTLKNLIYFAFEDSLRGPNVVIGPVLTNQSARAAKAQGDTVPGVLEEGGVIQVTEKRLGKTQSRLARIQARPFMLPAFEIEKNKTLPELWRDSV